MITARLHAFLRRLFVSRVLRDSSILLMSDTAALALALVTSVVLSRTLGAENYGLVILAMTSVSFINQFMDVRTGEAIIRFMGGAIARDERQDGLTYFVIGLAVDSVILTITLTILLVVVPPILGAHPQGSTLVPLAGIYLLTAPFATFSSSLKSILAVYKQFRWTAAIQMTNSALTLVLMLLFSNQGMTAVIWVYVAMQTLMFLGYLLIALRLLRRDFSGVQPTGYRDHARRFLPFAFHTSLMGSIKAVSLNIDILLLGALRTPSEVSFFRIARSAALLIAVPVTPIGTVIYPLLNEAWARRDRSRALYLILRYFLVVLAICSVGFLIYQFQADLIVNLVYGPEYAPVALLIRILIVGVLLESLFGWIRQAALSDGRPQLVTFTGFAAFCSRVISAVSLIYALGAVGAGLSYGIAVAVSVTLNLVYVLPRLNLIGYRNTSSSNLLTR